MNEEDDLALWEKVAKTIKRKSLHKRISVPTPKKSSQRKTRPAENISVPAPKINPGKGFDRSTETKLKKGALPIDGRLDLHGMTQEKAFAAVLRFLARAITEEKRTLLIITGKGSVMEGGVLRRMLPLWLEDERIKGHVLSLVPARPKDGGAGAFYLRLRKTR